MFSFFSLDFEVSWRWKYSILLPDSCHFPITFVTFHELLNKPLSFLDSLACSPNYIRGFERKLCIYSLSFRIRKSSFFKKNLVGSFVDGKWLPLIRKMSTTQWIDWEIMYVGEEEGNAHIERRSKQWSMNNLLGWKSGASCLAMMTAKSASSRAWTATTSAISALPRAVDVREMAMSAFCNAILEARWAALTAASIRSRNFADRIRNRCFFFCDVISTLFLYLPSSLVPSCEMPTEWSWLTIS